MSAEIPNYAFMIFDVTKIFVSQSLFFVEKT